MILVYDEVFDSLTMFYYDAEMNMMSQYGRDDGVWGVPFFCPTSYTPEQIRKLFASKIIYADMEE